MLGGNGLHSGKDGALWTRQARRLAIATLCLATLAALGGCDLPGLGPASATSPLTTPLAPSASATPLPWGGAPRQLPAGWSVYYAPHFSIALPPGWRVAPMWVQKDPRPDWWRMDYGLYSSANDPRGAVAEWDDLSAERVRDDFCAPTSGYEARTVAGLSMRFSHGGEPMGGGDYSPFERDWTFISDHRTVYWLWVYDGPNGSGNESENRAIVETFAPQYATWGSA